MLLTYVHGISSRIILDPQSDGFGKVPFELARDADCVGVRSNAVGVGIVFHERLDSRDSTNSDRSGRLNLCSRSI